VIAPLSTLKEIVTAANTPVVRVTENKAEETAEAFTLLGC
jgi:hypothetical protein